MITLRFLLEKEFRQIFRNPAILRIVFMMPLIQLLVLPWAADYEIKNLRVTVFDQDRSTVSRALIERVTASGYFQLQHYASSYTATQSDVNHDRADVILTIPAHFERNLVREHAAQVFITANAINSSRAGLGTSYLQSVVAGYNNEIRPRITTPSDRTSIEVISSNRFNKNLNYQLFMVPGIIVILVTMVGSFLASLNIVREKEIGTIEQINVTPVKKYQFLLGKLIPFWILGLATLSIGLLVARIVYQIVPLGNMVTIYIFAAVYLFTVLGLGLLISTYSATQQQAMLVSFFLMMIFILMGGLYTPVDSMPGWARVISSLNPVTYFIEVMRMVVLKGSGIVEIKTQLVTVLIFGLVLNGWAILNYRKQS